MLERRGFLRGLASLPLIGGSVAILGRPTQAAVLVTPDLLHSYKSWLHMEHRMVSCEMAKYDYELGKQIEHWHACNSPSANWHLQWSGRGGRGPAGWIDAPQPSTRAAIVLSAVGCPLAREPGDVA